MPDKPLKAHEREELINKYWEENHIFEKSVSSRPEDKLYAFYDGPPFATGLPHYGHIIASCMKDVVPRYWTMKGYRVERKWGWDCHGLPIENLVEKDLDLHTKKDIEDYGVEKFNKACHAKVMMFADEWKKVIRSIGRWVDMEQDYKTMDKDYMESVWWVFKELWDRDMIYQGYKSMHICPRCETPVSNFEVTQGYETIKDLSATAKFKLTNPEKLGLDGDVFILAWTTTPWTLPGNVLLAVGESIEYRVASVEGGNYIYAKELEESVMEGKDFEVKKELSGKELLDAQLTYEPLFPYFKDTENAFRVVEGDFVTTEDGTGIVHIAPAFGDDDYRVGERENVPMVQHVKMDGRFTDEVTDFAGEYVKAKGDHMKMDIEIVKWLAHHDRLFSKKKYEHSYPHCWRCDTPLLNYATGSWFVRVEQMRDVLVENNKKINWVPDHIKEGRFGKWLENARDWAISRSRFWGAPLPVWMCDAEDCAKTEVFGNAEDLSKKVGREIHNLHKDIVDGLTFDCDCGGVMRRIPEVLDCWFESGSMPYAQHHYPFENKEKFEKGFPAEFIAEGQDQTRGWFYTLHVLATALTSGENPSITSTGGSEPAFKNVIVNGIVLAEDGKKMSKRLKNYPDPSLIVEKYGADALRFYLLSSPAMYAENLNFSETGVREIYNKIVNTLWNVFAFYKMFADEGADVSSRSDNVLDQWIMARLQELAVEVSENMNTYKLAHAARPFLDFMADFSQWYVRRSRDRFKGADEADKKAAQETLGYVLGELSKLMAPFTPFIAEEVHRYVYSKSESVHLEMWPEYNDKLNEKVLGDMALAREVVEMALSVRAESGMKVRQALASCTVSGVDLSDAYKEIIREEVNVKDVVFDTADKKHPQKENNGICVALDTELTPELIEEGMIRDFVRGVNSVRKQMKLTREDETILHYSTDDELSEMIARNSDEIRKETRSTDIQSANMLEGGEDIKVGDKVVTVKLDA